MPTIARVIGKHHHVARLMNYAKNPGDYTHTKFQPGDYSLESFSATLQGVKLTSNKGDNEITSQTTVLSSKIKDYFNKNNVESFVLWPDKDKLFSLNNLFKIVNESVIKHFENEKDISSFKFLIICNSDLDHNEISALLKKYKIPSNHCITVNAPTHFTNNGEAKKDVSNEDARLEFKPIEVALKTLNKLNEDKKIILPSAPMTLTQQMAIKSQQDAFIQAHKSEKETLIKSFTECSDQLNQCIAELKKEGDKEGSSLTGILEQGMKRKALLEETYHDLILLNSPKNKKAHQEAVHQAEAFIKQASKLEQQTEGQGNKSSNLFNKTIQKPAFVPLQVPKKPNPKSG